MWRLGMPRSLASQFTPRNVIIMQTKPSMLNAEAGVPLSPGVAFEWRYKVKTVHVMSDHVSFGSQLQYLPHASLAHAAPENIANVRKGKPNITSLKAEAWKSSILLS